MSDAEWKAPLDITKEQWMSLLRDKETITEQDLRILKALYRSEGCKATSPQLAEALGMPHQAPINAQVGRLGHKIVDKLNIKWPKEEYMWFNVPCSGEIRNGTIYWILRPELQEAIWELDEEKDSSLEITIPEEIDLDSQENLYEGAKKHIYVNSYERNKAARDQCVRYYKAECYICHFDFEERYGEVGRGIIHVHHLKPLSDVGEKYRIDPIKDLRPVCPNCHVIIHSKNPPYSIEEVMAMIKDTGNTG